MHIHHRGYIVQDAEDPSGINPGLHRIASVIDPVQEAKICLYKNQQDELIELIQPLNEKSPVWNFLQKNGSGFHHYCYSCNSDEMIDYAKNNELVKIMGPLDATMFPDKKVVFYISRSETITEFIL
jgi:hypothetical protein